MDHDVVLVIDDEPQIRRVVRNAVEAGIARVLEAATGRSGIDVAAAERPSLVILDLGLPDMEGVDVCRAIRSWSAVPIIVLSARGSVQEKATMLDAGADDYIAKPFSTIELQARVRAQLRRAKLVPSAGPTHVIEADGAVIDLAAPSVKRDGVPIHLTKTEWQLLRVLIQNAGRTMTHRQLFTNVWGNSYGDAQQYLRVHIRSIRRKIERDSVRPRVIVTEPGVGYRFEAGAVKARVRFAGADTAGWTRWVVWMLVLIGVTLLMLSVRDRLNRAHVTIAYLLVVQLASANGGRPLGVFVAVAAFLAFNLFFLPPYGTLTIADPLDWLVLAAFLVTSIVSAELLYRAQELGAERARRTAAADRASSLEQSNRLKDTMLATVSHDLRTPLTTIKGVAHEIAAGGDERADVIEEEADRLNAFVGKLLDLSRVTLGAPALDVQPNEAEDLLGAAAQQVLGTMGKRPLQIHVDPSDSLLFGRFDFVQSLRVLVNLLENAAKYSPADSAIDLGVRRTDNRLEFWVADRGRGVAGGEEQLIFEPFYRRRAGGISDSGGAGLGLSIARGIAEAQGGSVTYQPREGGGSVFTLSVPAIDLDNIS